MAVDLAGHFRTRLIPRLVTGEYLPDFAGFKINYFKLTINSLTLDVPGSDPNEDGIWTDYSADLQIEVYGEKI